MVKIFGVLFAAVNLCAFATFGIDKYAASAKESCFFRMICGGASGALLGIRVWQHKTQRVYFVWGSSTPAILEIGLTAYIFI